VAAFFPKAPTGAMATQKANIIAKWQKLFLNGANKRCVIAAGQIGTANGAIEQNITDDRKTRFWIEKDHMAGRMARTMKHIECVARNSDLVTFFKPAIRCYIAYTLGQSIFKASRRQIIQQKLVILMGANNVNA